MDAKTCERIFDPFFTTKFPGRGFGLAAILGIVRGHKGLVKIESETEKGMVMQVLFPESGARNEPRIMKSEPAEIQKHNL